MRRAWLRTVSTVKDALVFWVALAAAAALAVVGYWADWLNAGAALGMLVIIGALVWERGRRGAT